MNETENIEENITAIIQKLKDGVKNTEIEMFCLVAPIGVRALKGHSGKLYPCVALLGKLYPSVALLGKLS